MKKIERVYIDDIVALADKLNEVIDFDARSIVILAHKLNEVIDVVNELIETKEKTSKELGSWIKLTLKELEKIKKEVNKC